MSKRKLKIILNVLLHYNKYEKLIGEQVKIIKNNGLKKYDKLIGEIGVVYDFEYVNFKKPFIIWFPTLNKKYCFSLNEFKQIGGKR